MENAAPCGTAAPAALRDTLHDLARQVVRLVPDHRDPERFWQDKSEIARALRVLARELAA